MLKLYRFSDTKKEYWEAWDNDDGTHTVHWGELGTKGKSREIPSSKAEALIQKEMDEHIANGFGEMDQELTLVIEYAIEGMGKKKDVAKRHRLEDRLNETLGWTGLGHCDGGSVGGGTMEVFNFVVDFELAKAVIEADLKGSEFEDFTRIYCEDED